MDLVGNALRSLYRLHRAIELPLHLDETAMLQLATATLQVFVNGFFWDGIINGFFWDGIINGFPYFCQRLFCGWDHQRLSLSRIPHPCLSFLCQSCDSRIPIPNP
jgi:hypothetical protein